VSYNIQNDPEYKAFALVFSEIKKIHVRLETIESLLNVKEVQK